MNSFAMINLFFGIDTTTQPDITAAEAVIAAQYVARGETQVEAQKKLASLTPASEATRCHRKTEIIQKTRSRRRFGTHGPQSINRPVSPTAMIFTATDAGDAKVPRYRADGRGETAGQAHASSPAARRRPDRYSSRCSSFRRLLASGITTEVMPRSRSTISRASSSRPV